MSSVSPLPATPATVQSPQPIRADSTACRITVDVAGRLERVVGAEAAGRLEDPLDRVRAADHRLGRAVRVASASRSSERSTQTIRSAPCRRQPITAPRPTMPAPKTTHVEPGLDLRGVHRGAEPGREPAREEAAPSSGASGLIFASAISGMTVYSANVEVPMKWRIGSPPRDSRVVPSGR